MGRPSSKSQYIEDVVRLYVEEEHSLGEIASVVPVSIQTLSRWLQEDGIALVPRNRNSNAGRTPEQQAEINAKISKTRRGNLAEGKTGRGGRPASGGQEDKVCPICQTSFTAAKARIYCSMSCAASARAVVQRERVEKEWLDSDTSTCVCGQKIPYENRNNWSYCSPECRTKYGKKRQPDPANQITFNCDTCGTEVTRWRGYGNSISGKRFCSNTCAAKHTKTVRHYVVRETDMVLDSTWEMLFAGACGFDKVPCIRVDRSTAVTAENGSVYAPDFLVTLPREVVAIEVKGWDNGDQVPGRDAWREQMGRLVVMDREMMGRLRSGDSIQDLL